MRRLNLSKETIDKIVEMDAKIAANYSKSPGDYEILGATVKKPHLEQLQRYMLDPDRARLGQYVQNLSENQQEELTAMIWIGRDYGEFADFDSALSLAKAQGPDVKYICSKSLHAYLPRAIEIMAAEHIELS